MSETPATYLTNGNGTVPLSEANGQYVAEIEERLAALEWALDSPEWRRLTMQSDQEFTRMGLHKITELCRVMYLKNPLIKRSVTVKRFYVWGQGWTIRAKDEAIQAAIDAFLYDQKNDDVLGSHEARMQLEIELETDGNIFFCFFINSVTGRIRVRTITFDQIDDIIFNPDDAKEPWFYKRVWAEQRTNLETGAMETTSRTAYYPDWRYRPVKQPPTIASNPVYWDRPVYHVRVGGFSNWKFGLSEVYASIDWAAAYKNFLEDWASIVRAYRRFAFQLTTPGGNKNVAAAKAKLSTTLGSGNGETNPAPLTGSTFIASEGHNLQPVRTSGATVSAEDGRRLLLMVAADAGLSETFYGDADIGTLATAKSLDRPTELMMEDRQQLWRDVALNIIAFVEYWGIKAPQGALRTLGTIATTVEDGQRTETIEWNESVVDDVAVDFPPLVQHDIAQMVEAVVKAATLGKAGVAVGTIDLPTLSRLLLTTLGVADADEIVERLFPGGKVPADMQPAATQPQADSAPQNQKPNEDIANAT